MKDAPEDRMRAKPNGNIKTEMETWSEKKEQGNWSENKNLQI